MAGVLFVGAPGAITLATGATKTLVQLIAAANHRTLVHGWSAFCTGIVATDVPVQLLWLVQTDAGTMTPLTLNKFSPGDDETLQTTAQHTATAEPSGSTRRWHGGVHPQSGTELIVPPKSLIIPGGTRLGLVAIAGTLSASITISPWVLCEE